MRNGNWSRHELLTVLWLYASYEPSMRGTIPVEMKKIVSQKLGIRSVASVSMRLANFIARDPEMVGYGAKGLFGGGHHVDTLWQEVSDSSGRLDYHLLLRTLAVEFA